MRGIARQSSGWGTSPERMCPHTASGYHSQKNLACASSVGNQDISTSGKLGWHVFGISPSCTQRHTIDSVNANQYQDSDLASYSHFLDIPRSCTHNCPHHHLPAIRLLSFSILRTLQLHHQWYRQSVSGISFSLTTHTQPHYAWFALHNPCVFAT